MAATTNPREVLQVVTEFFELKPEWKMFFNEVLGMEGIVRRTYPSAEAYDQFKQTEEYQQIKQMMEELRKNPSQPSSDPPVVITVRIPKPLHGALSDEARTRKISINTLCVAKLMQALAEDAPVPATLASGRAVSRRAARPR